jgi:hypothetical protein
VGAGSSFLDKPARQLIRSWPQRNGDPQARLLVLFLPWAGPPRYEPRGLTFHFYFSIFRLAMTGKLYYRTTLAAWQRHAHRFAASHWIALEQGIARPENSAPLLDATPTPPDGATPILVLIEADEGAQIALEDDPAFEPLPHPLAQKPISTATQSALALHGIPPGATTFEAAEALARVHPLLRHRVF